MVLRKEPQGAPGNPVQHPRGMEYQERSGLSVGAGSKKVHTLTSAHSPWWSVQHHAHGTGRKVRVTKMSLAIPIRTDGRDRGPRNGSNADPRMSAEWLHILGGVVLEDLEARRETLPSNSTDREQ